MTLNKISLNGKWSIDYISKDPYESEIEPKFFVKDTKNKEQDLSAVTECDVPGYFEDMTELFRTTPLHSKLTWNPLYTLQKYPQAGYCPDMALPNPVGCFLYFRTFEASEEELCHDADLYVGGAQNTVSAWVNGVYLGRHEGYSAEFFMKIPQNTLRAGENTVTLAVSNNRLRGYMGRPVSGLTTRASNECTGGIWGDVEVRFHPDGLRDAFVRVKEDLSAFTLKLVGGGDVEKTVRIFDGEIEIDSAIIAVGESEYIFSASGYEHWSPDSPKLYRAVVTTPREKIELRFGIRRLTSQGTRLYLNGKPYFFRGTCEHCYHPITVHPTRDPLYYRRVIRTLKKLGFNSIRFHTYVPMPEYMAAADELGMVMEVETPNNTTYAEWVEIVNHCRHFTSVCAYSSGNEMLIDEDYIEHLRKVSEYVHSESDALTSPMSAMRGIEYFDYGDLCVEEPFPHNPKRLEALGQFSDLYNSYSLGYTSYFSSEGDASEIDRKNSIYKKPILTHEICIHGTYIDLSLKDRYKGSRIGETAFMSSVEEHLEKVGILDKAPLYYRNSVEWQKLLRKHCFETVRRSDTFAGYDFLGDIDTHWHTFGYCVGMMNEFYELKGSESVENVLRYNSDAVLLLDLPYLPNFTAGEKVSLPVNVSNYGEPLERATLLLTVKEEGKMLLRREVRLKDIPAGEITRLYDTTITLPTVKKPTALTVRATLYGENTDAENVWQIYVFPKVKKQKVKGITVCENIGAGELMARLGRGERVVLLGVGPFKFADTKFQLSVAGRTNGHLATVIADHPLMADFPHDGYCGWQFGKMLNGKAAILDLENRSHDPIIDIATSYKNAHKEALMFEYRVGVGKLLVCTMNLTDDDPGAVWLRERMLSYAASDSFAPAQSLSEAELSGLFGAGVTLGENQNLAQNKNDITM